MHYEGNSYALAFRVWETLNMFCLDLYSRCSLVQMFLFVAQMDVERVLSSVSLVK